LTALAARGVSKAYGPVRALIDADIDLAPGQIHAIVGENGAGKSTLAKILAGVVAPDRGEILVDGIAAASHRQRDALAHGIGFVPQGLSLIGALTLIENRALTQRRNLINVPAIRRELERVAWRSGLGVTLNVPTGRLSVAERQRGELLIALAEGARILLLDEPTSLLGPREVSQLIRSLRDLARDGAAIGLVTHRIAEVIDASDVVTVLRGGRRVHHGPSAALSTDDLTHLMVGVRERTPARRLRTRDERMRIEAKGLSVTVDDVEMLGDVDLDVRRGEIVGIAGGADASQAVLAAVLAGLRRPDRGTVMLDGVDITGAAARACDLGLAHIADDRQLGLVPDLPVAVNASLLQLREPGFSRLGLRHGATEIRYGRSVCDDFGVRPPLPRLPVAGLSGGNQQKLILARELQRKPTAIVAHSPTQGLDLAAAAGIHHRLSAAAAGGAAIVVISADLDEVIAISDRLLVLSGGQLVHDVDLSGVRRILDAWAQR